MGGRGVRVRREREENGNEEGEGFEQGCVVRHCEITQGSERHPEFPALEQDARPAVFLSGSPAQFYLGSSGPTAIWDR